MKGRHNLTVYITIEHDYAVGQEMIETARL
jgi:hypothetical protein